MVHVYNWHPFASQQIVPTEQEPGLVCCGGDALFVVSAGGCKIEAYKMQEEGCSLICRFATMGTVQSILHSQIGDYLVTIEEKNRATYLRAYTNWRYQAVEKTRVGVRLLGHFLRASSFRGAPKEQMEIIEIPLVEPPLCVACCAVTGDLLVGCAKSLVIFSLRRQALSERLSVLDFERFLILHVPGWTPTQVALCAGFVALQMELEVLVVKLERFQSRSGDDGGMQEPRALVPKEMVTGSNDDEETDAGGGRSDAHRDPDDFIVFQRNQEFLGEEAKECGIPVSLEWAGMEDEVQARLGVTYVLYRRFAPDFFQGCSVEETCLHSLQLRPMFTVSSSQEGGVEAAEPTCVFCFFSLPNTGYMYSLRGTVELISTYQFPEKAQQAVLCDQFLHVITRNALQCFSVRCSAVAARVEDPYIDTTMKACPAFTMQVCALRIQLFIGLKSLCHDRNHVVLLTAADAGQQGAPPRTRARTTSRKTSIPRVQEPSEGGHGWNLYVVNTVSTLQLYSEMVEYSQKYEVTNPLSHSCVHLLSEAHLLLRAALLDPRVTDPSEREGLQRAFQESCAQLGDCYSRFDKRECHLALPYYKMSGLSVAEVVQRNKPFCGNSAGFGKGFLFYLKHSLYEETMEELNQETADAVLDIFGEAEPAQLPHVVISPFLCRAGPAHALAHLERLEAAGGAPSVVLTLAAATLALRLGDAPLYRQQMGRHAEMLQVYGFIEEPKLLLQGRGKGVVPTPLAHHLRETQEGLLVAALVALHENSKVRLEEADVFFQELCRDGAEPQGGQQLLVDFWEALLVASSQDPVIQELLFRLTSVYIDRVARGNQEGIRPLKTAEDLINSCCHYGTLYPWVSVVTPTQLSIAPGNQEDLEKLQSLLCGPSLDVCSVLPLVEQLSDADGAGLSIHVLCAARLGQHESAIDRLLDRCPQALIPYANHELRQGPTALWWQKVFPELCKRARSTGSENPILLSALKETLVTVAAELNPLEFLELLPDDGTAAFFLPHLLECCQRNATA